MFLYVFVFISRSKTFFSSSAAGLTDFGFAGKAAAEDNGLNPGLIVLLVIGGPLLVFLISNYVLYVYAQKKLPPRKKKPEARCPCPWRIKATLASLVPRSKRFIFGLTKSSLLVFSYPFTSVLSPCMILLGE